MSIVLSVPKNLTFLIPEILARLAIAGRARTLPVPPVGRPSGGGRRILGMLKRHEVEILLKASLSKAEVARLAGVSLRSVNRIAEEVPVPCLVRSYLQRCYACLVRFFRVCHTQSKDKLAMRVGSPVVLCHLLSLDTCDRVSRSRPRVRPSGLRNSQ